MINILVSKFTVPLVLREIYHPPILIIIQINIYKSIEYNLFIYNFYSIVITEILSND